MVKEVIMKTIHSALIRWFFFFVAALLPAYAFSQGLGASRVTLVEGEVELYMQDSGPPFTLLQNMSLRESDRLWVPDGGRAEIYLRGGSYVRLGGGTSLTVLSLEDGSASFYLEEGRLYINGEGQEGGRLGVDTPVTSVSAEGGAVFMVDVPDPGNADVSVLKGSVRAEGPSADTMVMAGEALHVQGERYAELSALGPGDEWERWNSTRDRSIPRLAESKRYLPEELYEYAPEFDGNGRWVYVSDYGYVWRPVVALSADWAPYRHGRWAWIGEDYVWVSYEPWGWAPYHYGRWAHLPRTGWCWVPPRHRHAHWGPGYVAWVRTPEYVAWVPLAPGEIYYGYGYYGPGTVSVINITINKTFYKNIHVHNAVTVVRHDRFTSGRKGDHWAKGNPFLDGKARFGPPVRPGRVADFDNGKPAGRHLEGTEKARPGSSETVTRKSPLIRPSSKPGKPGESGAAKAEAGLGKGRGDKPAYASKTQAYAPKADNRTTRQYGTYGRAEASRGTGAEKLDSPDGSKKTVSRSPSPVLNSSKETGTYSKKKPGPPLAKGSTSIAETARPSRQIKAGQGAAPGNKPVAVTKSKTREYVQAVKEVKGPVSVSASGAPAKAKGGNKGVVVQVPGSKTKAYKEGTAPGKGQPVQGYKKDQGEASGDLRGGWQPSYGKVQAGGKARGFMR
jgi:hypothetical protein